MTLDGFRTKFRQAKCDIAETPTQFVVRMFVYLSRWPELAKCEDSYTKLFELFLKEQFLNICDKNLATYLQEKPHATIDELTERAEAHPEARQRTLYGPERRTRDRERNCFICGKTNHVAKDCRSRTCTKCNEKGHEPENCKGVPFRRGVSNNMSGNLIQTNKNASVNTGRTFTQSSKSNVVCFLCGTKGHVARECQRVDTFVTQQAAGAQSVSIVRESANNADNTDAKQIAACCMNTPANKCYCVGKDEIKLACGQSLPVIMGLQESKRDKVEH